MSDYFHEQMVGKMKLEVTVPIDDNTTFPIKILTEGKAKEMVLKALEDVRTELIAQKDAWEYYGIEKDGKKYIGFDDALEIVERKIAEVKGDNEND